VRNVGALKVANLHCSRQQCVVVEWSGRSVAVRVRVGNGDREPTVFMPYGSRENKCQTTVVPNYSAEYAVKVPLTLVHYGKGRNLVMYRLRS